MWTLNWPRSGDAASRWVGPIFVAFLTILVGVTPGSAQVGATDPDVIRASPWIEFNRGGAFRALERLDESGRGICLEIEAARGAAPSSLTASQVESLAWAMSAGEQLRPDSPVIQRHRDLATVAAVVGQLSRVIETATLFQDFSGRLGVHGVMAYATGGVSVPVAVVSEVNSFILTQIAEAPRTLGRDLALSHINGAALTIPAVSRTAAGVERAGLPGWAISFDDLSQAWADLYFTELFGLPMARFLAATQPDTRITSQLTRLGLGMAQTGAGYAIPPVASEVVSPLLAAGRYWEVLALMGNAGSALEREIETQMAEFLGRFPPPPGSSGAGAAHAAPPFCDPPEPTAPDASPNFLSTREAWVPVERGVMLSVSLPNFIPPETLGTGAIVRLNGNEVRVRRGAGRNFLADPGERAMMYELILRNLFLRPDESEAQMVHRRVEEMERAAGLVGGAATVTEALRGLEAAEVLGGAELVQGVVGRSSHLPGVLRMVATVLEVNRGVSQGEVNALLLHAGFLAGAEARIEVFREMQRQSSWRDPAMDMAVQNVARELDRLKREEIEALVVEYRRRGGLDAAAQSLVQVFGSFVMGTGTAAVIAGGAGLTLGVALPASLFFALARRYDLNEALAVLVLAATLEKKVFGPELRRDGVRDPEEVVLLLEMRDQLLMTLRDVAIVYGGNPSPPPGERPRAGLLDPNSFWAIEGLRGRGYWEQAWLFHAGVQVPDPRRSRLYDQGSWQVSFPEPPDAPPTIVGEMGVGFGDEQFALIPAGTFQMGSEDGRSNEQPVHTVTLTQDFYMQRTPVTQGQWREIMGENPSRFSDCGDTCPVERVSWNDAQAFIQALNQRYPGRNYRLPTEAEWEYAARAGTTGDYGGTGVLGEMGWYRDNSGGRMHPVALKQPNGWNLYDMHGNVSEWVQDWYRVYTAEAKTDPTGPTTGSFRVLRGGSWFINANRARSAYRSDVTPSSRSYNPGFRLARTP